MSKGAYAADLATPKVTVITGDATLPKITGIYVLTKGSAAAITLTAPSGIDGTRLTVVSGSDQAHVITATSLVWDGTTGVNTTGTFQAFRGASVVLVAYGSLWMVESANNVAWT